MSPDVIAFTIAFVFGVIAGLQLEKAFANQRRARWRERKGSGWERKKDVSEAPLASKLGLVPEKKLPDAADQLRTVMKADFKAQPLLNKSEARLFKAIDKMVLGMRPDWQVMAQVSLGEILRCADKDAYACINAKRVDLLIVDEECKPLHAIEYQGGRALQGRAPHRRARRRQKGSATPRRDRLCRGGRRRHAGRAAAGGGEVSGEGELASGSQKLATRC